MNRSHGGRLYYVLRLPDGSRYRFSCIRLNPPLRFNCVVGKRLFLSVLSGNSSAISLNCFRLDDWEYIKNNPVLSTQMAWNRFESCWLVPAGHTTPRLICSVDCYCSNGIKNNEWDSPREPWWMNSLNNGRVFFICIFGFFACFAVWKIFSGRFYFIPLLTPKMIEIKYQIMIFYSTKLTEQQKPAGTWIHWVYTS